jgi:putative transposase
MLLLMARSTMLIARTSIQISFPLPPLPIKKALRPARRRALVDEVRADWQVSIRRACGVLRAGRTTYHYRPRRDDQAVLKLKIKEIAETRVRYGYRRIHVLLHREG